MKGWGGARTPWGSGERMHPDDDEEISALSDERPCH